MNTKPEQIIKELHKLKAQWNEQGDAHLKRSVETGLSDDAKSYHVNRSIVYYTCAQDLHDLTQTLK